MSFETTEMYELELTYRRGFQFVAMVVGKLSSVLWHLHFLFWLIPHTFASITRIYADRQVNPVLVNQH